MTADDLMRPRILIVEDDDDILALLHTVVEEEGMTCECASSGTEAELLLENVYFDAAVIDKNLPDADGILLANRARDLQSRIAIFIITGFPTEESARDAAALGADDYLVKPIDLGDFRDLLGKVKRRRGDFVPLAAGEDDEERPTLIPRRKAGKPPLKRVLSLRPGAQGAAQRRASRLGGLKVLLLDSFLERRGRIRDALEHARCKVTAFTPSDSLATLLEDERFEIVVAPPELLAQFTAALPPRLDRRPLVAMAIVKQRGFEPVIDAIRLGARGVLAPPFDRETVIYELKRAVSRALEEPTAEIELAKGKR